MFHPTSFIVVILYTMKNKSTEKGKKIPADFKVKTNLKDLYSDQPLFQDKIEKANHILKTVGLPRQA